MKERLKELEQYVYIHEVVSDHYNNKYLDYDGCIKVMECDCDVTRSDLSNMKDGFIEQLLKLSDKEPFKVISKNETRTRFIIHHIFSI